jgi:Leucine-rich repeat (LRR) protein
LEFLSIIGNNLNFLNLSKISKLRVLFASNNFISIIQGLNNLQQLDGLYVQNNQLTALNIDCNSNLRFLNISGNKIINLYVSKNNNLQVLLNDNPDTVIYFKDKFQYEKISANVNSFFPNDQQFRFIDPIGQDFTPNSG